MTHQPCFFQEIGTRSWTDKKYLILILDKIFITPTFAVQIVML